MGNLQAIRRKVILSVASLEDKQQHLAGPRLLNRLSGEAWRATEHLSVAQIRSDEGWLKVLQTLDAHYRFLPETELHESIDEFLFLLKRRGGEGATAFASRFKTQLHRLETLIHQERQVSKKQKVKHPQETEEKPDSSLEDSGSERGESQDEETDRPEEQPQAERPQPAREGAPLDPPMTPSYHGSRAASVASKSSARGSKRPSDTAGTYKADQLRAQRRMQRVLGTLEASQTNPKPVFPQSVLGHLFMRKYGLSREQRSLVIRSTGGSSRFHDIEKILRASDFEEQKHDDRRHPSRPPAKHRQVNAVTEFDEPGSSSSLDQVTSGDETDENEAMEVGQGSSDEELETELQEVYEIQKKAKKQFKKSFKTYKESKQRVKEIKKSRQPYLPVVALQTGDQPSSSTSQNPAKPERYERKSFGKGQPKRKPDGKPKPKREEVNLTTAGYITEFNYMVLKEYLPEGSEMEVLLASIPSGYAIIDTGCTTSVIGADTAKRYEKYFIEQGYPPPEAMQLPPVRLKGFNGSGEETTEGLKWTVRLGELTGNITTYVIPGNAPFLLSRKIMEGMEGVIDFKKRTLTSTKHGLVDAPLKQASNGHLLLSICPERPDLELNVIEPNTQESDVDDQPDEDRDAEAIDEPPRPETDNGGLDKGLKKDNKTNRTTQSDIRRAFQHIVKNTKNGRVDIEKFLDPLKTIFGENSPNLSTVLVAYKPKLERIPEIASRESIYVSVISLATDGRLEKSPWKLRPSGASRKPVHAMSVALFAFLNGEPAPSPAHSADESSSEPSPSTSVMVQPSTSVAPAARETCYCCSPKNQDEPAIDEDGNHNDVDLDVLYEDIDWTDLETKELSKESIDNIKNSIQSLRRISSRMTLSRILSERDKVISEVATWLGPQAYKLNKRVGLIEVFTGKALSRHFERRSQTESIRIGLEYGQDLNKLKDRRNLLLLIGLTQPQHVWYSFPCGPWSAWSRLNQSKSPQQFADIEDKRNQARKHLQVVSESWHLQTSLGGSCHAENPSTSLAWQESNVGSVWSVRIDQCATGLCSVRSGIPVKKPTRIISTDEHVVAALSSYICDGSHQHEHLEGNYKGRPLTSHAETYPNKLCRIISQALCQHKPKPLIPLQEVLAEENEELEELEEPDIVAKDQSGAPSKDILNPKGFNAKALIRKLHVNTGHASPEQMLRLAVRCNASEELKQEIRKFDCPICNELKPPASFRKSAIAHAEKPNEIVGVDYVQFELKKELGGVKKSEIVFNVLTCFDLATGFAQQVIVPKGPNTLSKAFHSAWTRPYGAPKMVYMDPAHASISVDFQTYLAHHDIVLLHCATDAHHQIGQVEIANRVLRNMCQRMWQTTERPPEELVEMCASVRNDHLRKCGYSPSQWFLGKEPRHAGMLTDMKEQENIVTQSQFFSDPQFASIVLLREEAAKAFYEEHAKDTWRRAVATRSRPMRGPYTAGQLVYMFRRTGRGRLSTRHGRWLGPGRIVGVESSRGSIVPRIVWVSYNGYLYRCSPEGHDLLDDAPKEEDHELDIDLREEPDAPEDPDSEGGPRKVRRRFYRSSEYWKRRNEGAPPLGPLHEGPRPHVITDPSDPSQDYKRRKVEFEEDHDVVIEEGASPSIAPANEPSEELPDIAMPEAGDSIPEVPGPSEGQPPDNTDEGMPPVEEAINTPVPEPGGDECKTGKDQKEEPKYGICVWSRHRCLSWRRSRQWTFPVGCVGGVFSSEYPQGQTT